MENFLKQLRVKFADLGQEDEDNSYYTGGRIPPRKTISFKGERKKPQSWFQRRFSGQMSYADDLSDGEFVTAVAAAASAIKSLEEHDALKQRKSDEELRKSLTKTRSKREADLDKPADFSKISRWFSGKEAIEDRRSAGERSMRKSDEELRRSLTKSKSKREESNEKPSDYSKISRWFSGKETQDVRSQGEGSMRKSTTLDQRFREESPADLKVPEIAARMKPTIKKTPTRSNKYQNERSQGRFEQGQGQEAGQTAPSNKKPQASIPGNKKWEGYTIDPTHPSKVETEADIWEKAKMDKIKNRHDKLIATIKEWENEKKTKAKRQSERKEREIEEKRARELQHYRSEMSRIDKIARGAREVADETRRNDEIKTLEKAKVYRSKGKIPTTCFCC